MEVVFARHSPIVWHEFSTMSVACALQCSPEKRVRTSGTTRLLDRSAPKYLAGDADIANIDFVVPNQPPPGPRTRHQWLRWLPWLWDQRFDHRQKVGFTRNVKRLRAKSCFTGMGKQQQLLLMFVTLLRNTLGLAMPDIIDTNAVKRDRGCVRFLMSLSKYQPEHLHNRVGWCHTELSAYEQTRTEKTFSVEQAAHKRSRNCQPNCSRSRS